MKKSISIFVFCFMMLSMVACSPNVAENEKFGSQEYDASIHGVFIRGVVNNLDMESKTFELVTENGTYDISFNDESIMVFFDTTIADGDEVTVNVDAFEDQTILHIANEIQNENAESQISTEKIGD